jgi:sodium transport system ATP-binding protein
MIEVRGLRKRFHARQAIRDVSFLARNGAITGLLGANGAGKSTTLRIISGSLRPDKGTVRIDELDVNRSHVNRASDYHARLGALLDHAGLYGRLTARENLIYYGELRGLSRTEARTRADEVLSCLGLASLTNRRAREFSLGERAKLALGRAILHSPNNLLLDEPTNGLDVPAVRVLRALLKNMRDAGCCIVFSSHVLDEVEQICDEVVMINNGAVVASGSLESVRGQTSGASLEEAFMQLTEAAGGKA